MSKPEKISRHGVFSKKVLIELQMFMDTGFGKDYFKQKNVKTTGAT